MKLLRWALAGASVYVVYKYSIGNKAKGSDVFVTPESDAEAVPLGEPAPAAKPKRKAPAKPKAK